MLRVRAAPRHAPSAAALRAAHTVRFDAPFAPDVVLPALAQAPRLRSVHLPLPPPAHAQQTAAALRALPDLRTVVVQPYAPPPPLPGAFLAALEGHAALETMSLVGCGVRGAEGARAVTALLASCGALSALWLGRNPLGADGGAALAAALAHLRCLRTLSLRACELPDRPALALAYAAAQQWPALRQLDVRGNALTPQGLAALHTLRARHAPLAASLLLDPPPPPPPRPDAPADLPSASPSVPSSASAPSSPATPSPSSGATP